MLDTHILIIDDDRNHAEALGEALEIDGYRCHIATSGEEGQKVFLERSIDIVLTDLVMHDLDGLEILKRVKERDADAQVIMITGHGSIPNVVEAMQHGASHYLEKPVNIQLLRAVVARQVEARRERQKNLDLRRQLDRKYGFEGIIGNSEVMRRNFGILQRVSPTDTTVLITGQSGTGKELIAKAIHNNSRRKSSPFVAVNCAALAEGVLESELFGHEKGAFTGATHRRQGVFEAADGGTLFLDELGDMPPATQVKLLRVIESREISRVGSTSAIPVNVRLVAATNQNLQELVDQGRFREDLFFRLNVVTIELPRLSDRPADIPLLIDAFVREHANRLEKSVEGVTPRARKLLLGYAWPGNVRELRNCIESMVTLSQGSMLDVDDVPARIATASGPGETPGEATGPPPRLDELEREAIARALAFTNGNREQAAKHLGIGERTLYRKLKSYELS